MDGPGLGKGTVFYTEMSAGWLATAIYNSETGELGTVGKHNI